MAGAGTLARENIANACAEVNIYDGEDAFHESIKSVPRQSLVLYAVFFCDSEIRNGGLRQLFGNSTGILVPEAIEGFRAIGLEACADAIEKASCLLGNAYPRDRWKRQEIIESLEYPGGDPNLITEYEPDINSIMNRMHLMTRKPIVRPFDELTDAYYDAANNEAVGSAADAFIAQKMG
jgi:hypothetical protein